MNKTAVLKGSGAEIQQHTHSVTAGFQVVDELRFLKSR